MDKYSTARARTRTTNKAVDKGDAMTALILLLVGCLLYVGSMLAAKEICSTLEKIYDSLETLNSIMFRIRNSLEQRK